MVGMQEAVASRGRIEHSDLLDRLRRRAGDGADHLYRVVGDSGSRASHSAGSATFSRSRTQACVGLSSNRRGRAPPDVLGDGAADATDQVRDNGEASVYDKRSHPFTALLVFQAQRLIGFLCQYATTPSGSRVPSARMTVASTVTRLAFPPVIMFMISLAKCHCGCYRYDNEYHATSNTQCTDYRFDRAKSVIKVVELSVYLSPEVTHVFADVRES